jgi:hypothetical protein
MATDSDAMFIPFVDYICSYSLYSPLVVSHDVLVTPRARFLSSVVLVCHRFHERRLSLIGSIQVDGQSVTIIEGKSTVV